MHGDLTTLTSGLRSDRFTEIRSIGMGSEGVVYAAFDRQLGAYVAIKTLRARTSADLHQLKREFRALAAIQHPNLVDLYELHVDSRSAWFSMEWIHGRSFTDALAPLRGDPRALLRRFVRLARPLCSALQAIHAHHQLHRDLKPSNVLVDDHDRVVVLDFGMVADLDGDGRLSRADSLSGTVLYMPPERIDRRQATAAADIYSLGVLFFEALTGDLPFSSDLTIAFLEKKEGLGPADVRRLARVEPRLGALIAAMVTPEPERRIDLAGVMALLDRLPGADEAPPPEPRPPQPPRLIGRDDETTRLRAWLASGPGRLIKVIGASGSGKTALCGDLVRELRAEGTRVLTGRCHPRETLPFNAIDGIVEALVGLLVIAGAEAEALLAGCGPALARVFPGFRRLPGLGVDPEPPELIDPAELDRGVAQLTAIVGRMQAKQPMVLWIDDAQWADVDSLHVLRAIRGVIDADMPHILLTSRGGEPLAALADHTLRLGELAEPDAMVVARAWLRADDPLLLQRIVDESRGNPFLLRFLAEHNGAASRSDRDGGVRLVPTIVRAILDELAPGEASVLRLLAVAGRALDLGLLRACGESTAALVALERRSLITRATPNHRLVELAHDRLREGVLLTLGGEATALHGRLADALLRLGGDLDPGATAEHLRQARRPAEALAWAVRAAERAEEGLAFDRAAHWWKMASEWAAERGEPTTAIERRLAAVLTAAGRCAEAGALHERLAAGAAADEARVDLLRAADNYLSSGQIARGCELVRPFLAEARISWPRSQAGAFLRTVKRIIVLRLRRPLLPGGAAVVADPDATFTVDLCWSLAKGLLAVDPARGAYFALEGLMRAQAAGDRRRGARHLAAVAAIVLGPSGGSLALVADDLLDHADALAREDGSDYLRGFVAVCRGQFLVIRGCWPQARDQFQAGIALLSRCPGTAWEQNIAWMGLLRVHMELGDMPTMRTEARAFAQRAEGLGDRYAQVTGGLYEALGLLSLGRPEKARQRALIAQRTWAPVVEFSVQHLYITQVIALSHALEGRPDRAMEAIDAIWPRLRRAQLLRIPVARIDALALRARVGLCLAKWTPDRQRKILAAVRRDADELMGEERSDAQGLGRLVAGICEAMSGEEDRAQERVRSALAAFDAQGMRSYADVCRALLERWRGGRALPQSDLIRLVIAGPLGNLESMRYS